MSPPFRSSMLWLVVALVALSPSGASAQAESLSEDGAKAGFIFNFTKYTEWPEVDAELLVCGLGADVLSGKLESLQGRLVHGREIRVRGATLPGEWRDCEVLFIKADEARRVEAVLRNTAQRPVLTISDIPGFAQVGGIIGLKLRAGRIRFDINQGAARQAGLKLSSQLLKLADEVLP